MLRLVNILLTSGLYIGHWNGLEFYYDLLSTFTRLRLFHQQNLPNLLVINLVLCIRHGIRCTVWFTHTNAASHVENAAEQVTVVSVKSHLNNNHQLFWPYLSFQFRLTIQNFKVNVINYQSDGLCTLHGTRDGKGNRTGTIGNNGSWSLFLSRTRVNISTWYYIFLLVSVPVLFPFPCMQCV